MTFINKLGEVKPVNLWAPERPPLTTWNRMLLWFYLCDQLPTPPSDFDFNRYAQVFLSSEEDTKSE